MADITPRPPGDIVTPRFWTWLKEQFEIIAAYFTDNDTNIAALDTRLDDIEALFTSGSFTPTLEFGNVTAGITYGTRSGQYLKIGNLVFIEIHFVLTSKGAAVGTAEISGLPFAAAQHTALAMVLATVTAGTGDTYLQALAISGLSEILLTKLVAGAAAAITNTDFTNTTTVRISGCYRTT